MFGRSGLRRSRSARRRLRRLSSATGRPVAGSGRTDMATETPSFLTSAWFIARKDVAHFMRIRETLLWVFVMPILYFWFIGTVTGGFGSPSAERRDRLAVRGGESGGLVVDEIMRRLADEK